MSLDLACTRPTVDPEWFFPDPSDKGGNAAAKRICQSCEAVDQCRTTAIETRQEYGVWGGLSEKERRSLARRKREGATR